MSLENERTVRPCAEVIIQRIMGGHAFSRANRSTPYRVLHLSCVGMSLAFGLFWTSAVKARPLFPGAVYAADSGPQSVVSGDFNGDQLPDLAVANVGSVSVLRGVGNGTFAATVSYAAGGGPVSVAIGDLDGDQVSDLAVANAGSDNVSVLLNQSSGACCQLVLAASPHNILKNRYISIDPRGADGINSGEPFDIRVTLSETLVNGVTAVGESWWANAPDASCISVVGPTQPVTPPDWSGCPTLHLTGCPIIPTSTYEIAAVVDGLPSGPPLVADTQAKPGVKWHGDSVGFFDGTVWTPPNGFTSIDDGFSVIKAFQDLNAFNAPHVTVSDLHPNLSGTQINKIVNFDDVLVVILAFQGQEYPGPQIELCQDP